MTRCKNCGDEIIRFSDRWAHVGDEGVLFSQCRITRAEPEEVEPEEVEPEKVGFVYKPYEYGTWTVPAGLSNDPLLVGGGTCTAQSIMGQTVCSCGWKPPLGVSAWRAVDRHIREMGEQE